jgi:serine/threonine-protein phosphatase 4 regulatory subunit 2
VITTEKVLTVLREPDLYKKDPPPEEVLNVVKEIATSGSTPYSWAEVKNAVSCVLAHSLRGFDDPSDLSLQDGDSLDSAIISPLTEHLRSFAGAPFTCQRLCELISNPKKNYSSLRRYAAACEKVLLVSSTDDNLAAPEPDSRKRKLGD